MICATSPPQIHGDFVKEAKGALNGSVRGLIQDADPLLLYFFAVLNVEGPDTVECPGL
ncbi:hypothetical protein CLV43_101880 [Umezawaea tangerina]|uniref:Uncharacterized protein n=1 Tax=Umezawaea tangerina TaxID=84725 RepID=A0A2T0TLL0_9PSEU|nr:hypothetical protein CLV43_101880 [Umezawaea tangerina]